MRATIVILNGSKILLIHRFYFWKEYFVFPGWGVESWESPEQACIREAKEETGLDVIIGKKLFEHKDDTDARTHYTFLISEYFWDLQLGWPEAERDCDDDRYILEWHELSNIPNLIVYPELLRDKVVKELTFQDNE